MFTIISVGFFDGNMAECVSLTQVSAVAHLHMPKPSVKRPERPRSPIAARTKRGRKSWGESVFFYDKRLYITWGSHPVPIIPRQEDNSSFTESDLEAFQADLDQRRSRQTWVCE